MWNNADPSLPISWLDLGNHGNQLRRDQDEVASSEGRPRFDVAVESQEFVRYN